MTHTCIKCGHTWRARTDRKPKQCPVCKSLRWDNKAAVTRERLINLLRVAAQWIENNRESATTGEEQEALDIVCSINNAIREDK